MLELRALCVEQGEMLPEHMMVIEGLRNEDNMMLAKKADRGKWADGLGLKDLANDSAEILFHAGCRFSFDEEYWPVLRAAVNLLKRSSVDFGIIGGDNRGLLGRRNSFVVTALGLQPPAVDHEQSYVEGIRDGAILYQVQNC